MSHSNEEIQTRNPLPIHLIDCSKEPHRKICGWISPSSAFLGSQHFKHPQVHPPTWHSTVHTIPCQIPCEHTQGIFLCMIHVSRPAIANLPHTQVPQHILDLRYLQWRWTGVFETLFKAASRGEASPSEQGNIKTEKGRFYTYYLGKSKF